MLRAVRLACWPRGGGRPCKALPPAADRCTRASPLPKFEYTGVRPWLHEIARVLRVTAVVLAVASSACVTGHAIGPEAHDDGYGA